MDNLLRQLRQSMAELSIQGEDFARQMWQMYEIFEEFLDTHIGWNSSLNHSLHPSSSEETEEGSPCFRSQTTNDMRETFPHDVLRSSDLAKEFYGSSEIGKHRSSTITTASSSNNNNKAKGSEPEVCNPLLETISTIEILGESDDYSDLPECYLRAKARAQGKMASPPAAPTISVPTTDGDKDSIGYAGSNSIDSGYKSSCPTPDLSDGSVYGGGCNKLVSGSSSSSLTRGCDAKPRIAMGTRVMHRQHQHSYGSNGPGFQDVNLDHLMYLRQTLISAMQHCENSSATTTTAPSSPSPASAKVRGQQWSCLSAGSLMDLSRPRRMPSPTLGSRQLRTPSPRPQRRLRRVSSPSLSTCSHPIADSVDISGDIYQQHCEFYLPYENAAFLAAESKSSNDRVATTSVLQDSTINNVPGSSGVQRNTRPPSPVPSSPNHFQKTVRFSVDNKTNIGARTVDNGINNVSAPSAPISAKSKPILKDPICANLRSHLEFSADDITVATLEEEIDTLLYGRTTERRRPSSDSELPCSYVTMIEDKYRKSSVAKVKKLRDKSLPCSCQTTELEVRGSSVEDNNALLLDDVLRSPITTTATAASNNNSTTTTSTTTTTTEDTCSPVDMKSRFSEVAKCMLEVVDDLQRQKMAESQVGGSPASAPPSPARDSSRSRRCEQSAYNYESGRLSGADYHVYEEIIYDLNSSQKKNAVEHPTSFVTVGGHQRCAPPPPPAFAVPPPLPRRPNGGFLRRSDSGSSVDKNAAAAALALATSDSSSAASCQPKQRLNLYSLFRQQSDRRSIALSLEQEWRLGREENPAPPQDDDYGFRMVSHPM